MPRSHRYGVRIYDAVRYVCVCMWMTEIKTVRRYEAVLRSFFIKYEPLYVCELCTRAIKITRMNNTGKVFFPSFSVEV